MGTTDNLGFPTTVRCLLEFVLFEPRTAMLNEGICISLADGACDQERQSSLLELKLKLKLFFIFFAQSSALVYDSTRD